MRVVATTGAKPKRERWYTEQDLLNMPDDGRKYELVDGTIQVVPTGARHGMIGFRLANKVSPFITDRYEGFDSSTGFRVVGGNSPTEDPKDLMQKVFEYFESGSREVWLLFPERKQVHRYTAPLELEVLNENDLLTGGELLPGFEVRVKELFE